MAAKEVKVYSTPTCPWCRKAKQWLDANKIAYTDFNVAQDHVARDEMVKKSSQTAVPTIFIDGEIVVGFNEPVLKEKLGIK